MKNTRGQKSEVRGHLIALIPLIALLSLPSLAQKAGKGSLRDSALVVTNETDTAALAAVAAVADTWAAAIEQEAVYRGQGNAAQQAITVAATNALNAAIGPRIVWATNRIEEVNAALAASFIEGLAAERYSRQTNVAAWADAIWTDCRITNSATRLIAQSALAAASSVTGSQAQAAAAIESNKLAIADATNTLWQSTTDTLTDYVPRAETDMSGRTTRLWADDGSQFVGGDLGIYRPSENVVAGAISITFSEDARIYGERPPDVLVNVPSGSICPKPGWIYSINATSGSFTLSGNPTVAYMALSLPKTVAITGTGKSGYFTVANASSIITQRVDTVVLFSDLTSATGAIAQASAASVALAVAPLLSTNGNGSALTGLTASQISGLPGPGCTDLGTNAVTITGATFSYGAQPTTAYTISVDAAAYRGTYAVEIISTNACTLGPGLNLRGTWTPTATNIVTLVPCTGTLWRVYGRGL